jgi:diguanylate cyclase (GGDEF)-like protein/PAS domain S-box-containing protein
MLKSNSAIGRIDMDENSNKPDLQDNLAGRKVSTNAIEESSRFFSTLAQVSPVGIFRTDKWGGCVYFNDRWSQITGISLASAVGAGWAQAIHPDDRSRVEQAWYTSARTHHNFIMEYRIQRPNGSIRWVLGQATAERDASGEMIGYVGTLTDITQSKQAEEELQRFFNVIPDLACIASTDGNFLKINHRWQELLGYTEREILAKPFLDLIHPDDRDATMKEVERQLAGEATTQFSNRYRCKDGSYKWLEWKATPAVDKKLLYASARDVTQSRQADKAREEAQIIFQKITQLVPGVVYQFQLRPDGGTCMPYVSDAFYSLFRLAPEDVREDASRALSRAHPDDLKGLMASIQASARGMTPWQHEYRLKFDDGTERCVFGNSLPQLEADGSILWHGFITDITEKKLAEQALMESDSRFREIFDAVSDAIFIHDAETGSIIDVNSRMCEMYGITHEEALFCRPDDLSAGASPYSSAEVIEKISMARTHGPQIFDWLARRRDGHLFWVEVNLRFALIGRRQRVLAVVRDISERKHAEEKINNLAFYDALTQLPNRRMLSDRMIRAMAGSKRSGCHGAVMFIDLDNFKILNDTLGHSIGDLLLQQVAHRLGSCIREGDTVARLGGDEFVVMLEDLSKNFQEAAAQAEAVGEKILDSLNRSYQLATHEHRSTPSIGVTLFMGQQQAGEELLKQADIAMYQSKKAGRNTLRFFDMQMQNIVNNRAALEGELRKALDGHQFQLYYQVQVDSSRRPLGAEALIRWIHPDRGLLSPAQFIPMAEETGLILPIGRWVLETACAQISAWRDNPLTRDLVLAVNVSAQQFRQAGFVDHVLAAIRHHAINPACLKLELTESLLLESVEDTVATMNALHEIGVQFSLDDFGTGYSSLQYLKRLPLDQLKIDQSFVHDISTDSSDRAIVSTIIAMANSLHLGVIAEGVETEDQRQLLQDNGSTHYQGYLFGKPIPIEQFEALLKNV